ncbi:hypothetical protein O181_109583 [Austropuccinia psidii MF-1]|uniref:Integrase zinc-binding domain-containing protein n=1 Tax=Austropuccinia psidii MF-1 TaxID=1389203 RepID=A0A9Q3PPZ4_9BASI|nr:hypothetical protein [Austropuccinia psidii MF-1]
MMPNIAKGCLRIVKTCDRCQKLNKSTAKRVESMIKIQKPRRTHEIDHMDWVTGLPSGGDRSYNFCLPISDRFSKTPIFIPCHKDDTAMDAALLIWSRVVSRTDMFTKLLLTEIPDLSHKYRKIFNNYLRPSYPSLWLTFHKLMAQLKKLSKTWNTWSQEFVHTS